jgi:uncharacterized protein YxjI
MDLISKMNEIDLSSPKILVKQRYEIAEFMGYETRNKYEIQDAQQMPIGFAAEQQKGIVGFFLRQFLGHWRTFDLHFFNLQRQRCLTCHHPFRFFFQRFEVYNAQGEFLGALQQKFSILSKKFDIEDRTGAVVFEMSSPLLKMWTFPIRRGNFEVAVITKKWSGVFTEILTDKDNFEIDFISPNLTLQNKQVILAAAIFIDLQYFEAKAKSNRY